MYGDVMVGEICLHPFRFVSPPAEQSVGSDAPIYLHADRMIQFHALYKAEVELYEQLLAMQQAAVSR
jgi:hypothetical protein